MKTSNKLLIGLVVCIVLSMIIFNITIKNKMDKIPQNSNQVEMKIQTDSISTDSVAMDSAIGNE